MHYRSKISKALFLARGNKAFFLFGLLFVFLLKAGIANAQVNYVLNPSFEEYSQCPYTADQITLAYHWSSLDSTYAYQNQSCGDPEYLNICGTNLAAVPTNGVYHHYPRTGNGMVFATFYSNYSGYPYVMDYVQGRLFKPLTAGRSYCVTFYVVMAQYSAYAINHIGAYLDNGIIDTTTVPGQPQTQYTPQILEEAVIGDTLNWTKIEGNFIANGTERFITIGNFFDTAHTIHQGTWTVGGGVNWYLVDDVSIVESDIPAFAGNDTTIGKGDTILLGRTDEALDCKWYVDGNLIDSGSGIKVHPDITTTYVEKQTVCGLIKYDTVTVTVWPLGVHELNSGRAFTIYPNPSSGELIASFGSYQVGDIIVYNMMGQEVYTSRIRAGEQKHISLHVPDGVYMVAHASDSGERRVQRVVITNR